MKLLITGASGFIGTNVIDLLLSKGINDFINVDKQQPHKSDHKIYWVSCNILEREVLQSIFDNYQPTHVLHLAARTDTSSNKLKDYFDNTEGTANLIHAIENSSCVQHFVITSTQYVYKKDEQPIPVSDQDYKPHTMYGVSKKLTEEMTRNSKMKSAWTIVRPTNVWGPWNMRYPNELWKIIDQGLYFHPKGANPVKSFAYVKNVAHQMVEIILSTTALVDKQVYYVGDVPTNSTQWINYFSKELTGKSVRYVPQSFMYTLSFFGTLLNKIKIPFPLNLSRFKNMKDDYITPMQKTIDAFGLSHPDLEANVKETIFWFKKEGNSFFPYWNSKLN
jgi:nucleoside-diphosphate-sugar epimerase